MRIHIIMPVLSDKMNDYILNHFDTVASPETELSISTLKSGTISIESMYDEEFVARALLEECIKQERNGVDGIINYCFGNPATEAAKEILNIPVIGIGEASQTIALPFTDNYGIITTVKNSVARNRRKAKLLGTSEKLGAVIPLDLPVVELTNHNENLIQKVKSIVKPYVENQGIDLIHLGCGYLIGLSDRLSKELGIPVVDPGLASLKLMEAYVKLSLVQSPVSYMTPPEKKRV